MLALCLPTQDAPGLLGFTAPLAVPVKSRGAHEGRDLLVGVLALALNEVVQALPQGHHGGIDDLARDVEQTQGIDLHLVGQAHGIAEGLYGSACAHHHS